MQLIEFPCEWDEKKPNETVFINPAMITKIENRFEYRRAPYSREDVWTHCAIHLSSGAVAMVNASLDQIAETINAATVRGHGILRWSGFNSDDKAEPK